MSVLAVVVVASLALGVGAASAAGSSAAHNAQSRRLRAAEAVLARMGPDGRAAVAFVKSTAPRFRGAHLSGSTPPASTLSGIGKALSGNGGGGMGFPLPLLLFATLVCAIGVAAWRVLRRAPSG